MKQALLLSAFVIIIASCMSKKATSNSIGDTSMNSLDWPGTYAGVLPCADCEGLVTQLKLIKDGSYALSQTYKGKSELPLVRSGTFTWNQQGNIITLAGLDIEAGASMYQVGENRLTQLDLKGDLSSKYNLGKLNTAIVNKYWKLTELNGQPFVMAENDKRESHLILREKDNQFAGTGGCNNFVGSYELMPGDRIRFLQNVATTLLPCGVANQEAALLNVLQQADNYSVSGDTLLSLNRMRMAPLARFRVVYFN